MEFSPTAEKNRIYDSTLRPITANSKQWFLQPGTGSGDARQNTATASETAATRAFARPVAENILMLVISPQTHTLGATGSAVPTAIAPAYAYDSVLVANATASNPQGTQHLLPPLLKVAMVALDARSGETLSGNPQMISALMTEVGGLFNAAANFDDNLNSGLVTALNQRRLSYRIFTTTIPLKQARWSK